MKFAKLLQSPPVVLLMDLGQFFGHGNRMVATHDFHHFGECLQQAVRRLIKDRGHRRFGNDRKALFSLLCLDRQEPFKIVMSRIHSGKHQRTDTCNRPRNGRDIDFFFDTELYQIFPRIGDTGHTGVRDQSNVLPFF